jgi:hypothetical protein
MRNSRANRRISVFKHYHYPSGGRCIIGKSRNNPVFSSSDGDMTANQMIKLMNRAPFEPFKIHMSAGAHIRVEHHYQIATQPNSPTCIVYGENDEMHFVSYRNITEVITGGNGEP